MQTSELIATAMVLGFFLVMVFGGTLFFWRQEKLRHEERRQMIEKGMTPPPVPTSVSWQQVKERENQLRFEERRLMIEKGLVPPAEWADGKRWRRDDFLRRGLVMFFLGIGLGITYYLRPEDTPALAFVSPSLALVGLGCLAYYALSKDPGGNAAARNG